jgi:hypothetical protein
MTVTTRTVPREVEDVLEMLQDDLLAARQHMRRYAILIAPSDSESGRDPTVELERLMTQLERRASRLYRFSDRGQRRAQMRWVPEDLADRP